MSRTDGIRGITSAIQFRILHHPYQKNLKIILSVAFMSVKLGL